MWIVPDRPALEINASPAVWLRLVLMPFRACSAGGAGLRSLTRNVSRPFSGPWFRRVGAPFQLEKVFVASETQNLRRTDAGAAHD